LRGRVLTRKVEPFLRLPPRSRVADTRLRFHSPDLCGAVQQLYADFIREALHPDQTSAHKNHRATSKLIARLPDDPDVADLSAWVSALRNAYARSTADLHRQNLGAVLQWGNDTGRCYGHPLRALRFRREAPKTAVIWKFAEVWPRVLGLFDPETEQRERLFLAVCCYLAPRKGEALALRRDSFFQRRNGKWWVTFAEQREAGTGIGGELNQLKTRKARTLPVPPDLVNILLPVLSLPAAKIWVGVGGQRELESPYLLPFRGHEISAIRQRLRALPEFAANGNAFHMLRRSRAVQLRQQGKDTEAIQRVLGHVCVKNTGTYLSPMVGLPVAEDVFEIFEGAGAAAAPEQRALPLLTSLPGTAPVRPEKSLNPCGARIETSVQPRADEEEST
jgi:integrase